MKQKTSVEPEAGFAWRRLVPAAVLLAGLALFFMAGLDRYLSFSLLSAQRASLLAWVGAHPFAAPLTFVLLYIVVVAFSIPGAAVMTVSGGFLFGPVGGSLLSVTGATVGATILFLVAKTSLGDYLLAKAGGSLARMQAGFRDNAMSYLLVLRLIPVFPFFLVNLAPAFLGVPLRTYVIATFFGIMPGGIVYTLVGTGLGSVFDSGDAFSIGAVMTPEMLAALIGLALLAMLPVVYRRLRVGRS